jgi:hypothetical protein
MNSKRVFLHVDPMDRWLRLTVIADLYSEPASSLHEFVKNHNLRTRYNGKICYINERDYQDAIAALPDGTEQSEKQNKVPARGNRGNHSDREVPCPGLRQRGKSLDPLNADRKTSQIRLS